MRGLLEREHLPPPLTNQWIGPYETDFLWPERRLIVETDGYAVHGTKRAFESDRARDAQLMLLGYDMIRFTHRQITQDPVTTTEVLRRLLG